MFSIITAISWLEEEVKIGPIKISPEDIEKWINKIISIAIIIVLMYLIIRGADLCKSEQDRIDETEEESRILSEKYNNGGKFYE